MEEKTIVAEPGVVGIIRAVQAIATFKL